VQGCKKAKKLYIILSARDSLGAVHPRISPPDSGLAWGMITLNAGSRRCLAA
jgi:hypothetical protein